MKFHELDIQNFLTIRSAKLNLADRGLQIIQGVNEDDSSASSNGSGKSSIGDAISWCLYGLTAREVKGDSVVNLAIKKDCRVSLTISNGATRYRVIRHRKHAIFKNSLILEVMAGEPSDGPTDLSRGTDAETQKVLEKVIGCSYEVFMAAVYSAQEVMPDLPKMKDRELKTLIEEAAGLQRIERAYDHARVGLNTTKSRVDVLQASADSADANKARAEMVLAEVQEKFDAWERGSAERIEISTRIEGEVAEKWLAAKEELLNLTPEKILATDRSIRIDAELKSHKSAELQAIAAEKATRAAEMKVDAGLLKRVAAEVEAIKDQIANAAEEIKKPCVECGTVLITMSVEDYVKHKGEHLEAAKLRFESVKQSAREQMVEVLRCRNIGTALRAAVPNVSALVAENTANTAIITGWVTAEAAVNRIFNDMKAATVQRKLRQEEPNPNESSVKLSRDGLSEAIAKIASLKSLISEAQVKLTIATAVAKVFGPAGVRAQILDSVTPFLNEQTGNYLSALSDGEITAVWTTLTKGASGDLKEKFSIDVTHAKGGDSFIALSGGEKRKVRLSTALALQDLVASRATQPLDLLVLDEVDDALDPAGLERLMTILDRRARERGTVLVISHSSLKDWGDNITTVRKTELWNSTIEGELTCL